MPSYGASIRPTIYIPKDGGTDYSAAGPCDFPTGAASTFAYNNAIRVGNGFNAIHPSLKFLAPAYNAGDLVMVHRVGYPRQSRSHFDSQAYWETGDPNSPAREGIFYRTLLESGQTSTNPLTGVSIQSGLPTLLKGSQAALTNLSDPTRYDLVGTPTPNGDQKLMNSILRGNQARFADKRSRGLLQLGTGLRVIVAGVDSHAELAQQPARRDAAARESDDGDFAVAPLFQDRRGFHAWASTGAAPTNHA